MKIGLRSGLLWVDLLVLLCILAVLALPSSIIRIILGVPFVLFFPGFALITALYPRRTGLGNIERVALSIALSIAVVPLIGLILNYTPWGIHTNPILLAIAFFTLAMSAIAWWRQARIAEDERFIIHIVLPFAWPQGIWSGCSIQP